MRRLLLVLVFTFPLAALAEPFGACRLFLGFADQTDPSARAVISAFYQFDVYIGQGSEERTQEETVAIPLKNGKIFMTVNLKLGIDSLYALNVTLRKNGFAIGTNDAVEEKSQAVRHVGAHAIIDDPTSMPVYSAEELSAKNVEGVVAGHSYIFKGALSSCSLGRADQAL